MQSPLLAEALASHAVDELYIMVAPVVLVAVVLVVVVVMFTAGIISSFVDKHLTVKMLTPRLQQRQRPKSGTRDLK